MKVIVNIINNYILKEYSTKLGRWTLNTCYNKMKRKIDLANEDNCGPCGQYNNAKIININRNKKF